MSILIRKFRYGYVLPSTDCAALKLIAVEFDNARRVFEYPR